MKPLKPFVMAGFCLICAAGSVLAQGGLPVLALESAWVSDAPRACVQRANAALQASGFAGIQISGMDLTGRTPFLTARAVCVAADARTLGAVAVSGPAASGNAAPSMASHLAGILSAGAAEENASAGARPGRTAVQPTIDDLTTFEPGTDRFGADFHEMDLTRADPRQCAQACVKDPRCKAWTYAQPGFQGPKAHCWLKDAVTDPSSEPQTTSGVIKGR